MNFVLTLIILTIGGAQSNQGKVQIYKKQTVVRRANINFSKHNR